MPELPDIEDEIFDPRTAKEIELDELARDEEFTREINRPDGL